MTGKLEVRLSRSAGRIKLEEGSKSRLVLWIMGVMGVMGVKGNIKGNKSFVRLRGVLGDTSIVANNHDDMICTCSVPETARRVWRRAGVMFA